MTRLRRLGRFLRELVVGDDPLVALGVVVALGIAALLVALDVNAWWVVPPAVLGLLAASVGREAARARRS